MDDCIFAIIIVKCFTLIKIIYFNLDRSTESGMHVCVSVLFKNIYFLNFTFLLIEQTAE